MHGDATTAGMLEMLAAVRAYAPSAPVIIAGAAAYAYDSASLLTLDASLKAASASNIIWNFHPYMGPPQAGASDKCAAGFEVHLNALKSGTERPSIITEFGQACCPTTVGQCESCSGSYRGVAMGYNEQILTIATTYNVSWLPWAWRPPASNGAGKKCEDLNGGNAFGTQLAGPEAGNRGADFAGLWRQFAGRGSSGCPGGSLAACMSLCPASPPAAYHDCVELCGEHCPG